ncbi:MAG TPA: hypothetical protein DCR20_06580, partial [Planctomycetaceae bacterium]|nr:hypothetical protein [Planctomycetaceae bacterium]
MNRIQAIVLTGLLWSTGVVCSVSAGDDGVVDFNREVRPILAENCFYCHGQDGNKRQGELRLDQRQAALDRRAIVPADVAGSVLLQRVHSTDADLQMPPPNSGRTLTEQQKQTLQRWIEQGAKYSEHWAFTVPQSPAVPAVRNTAWVRNPIDSFVLSRLESEGLQPAPEADRAVLIRRLSIDLTGLPPTPQEVDAFVASTDPMAWEQLVDRLLSSPHYGERMALPWLDAARYADSNGFQQDGDTWQWIWRDWLVSALNQDLPFDQLTIWQLAGDLLPDPTTEQKIASGFNRNHLLNGEGGAIPEEQRWVILFDRMETTATTWLGLTLNCAQCHDHKYDPLTQRDYYSLLDGFNRVPESGTPQYFSSRIRVAAPFLEVPSAAFLQRQEELQAAINMADEQIRAATADEFQKWQEAVQVTGALPGGDALPAALKLLLAKPAADRSAEEQSAVQSELRKLFDQKVVPSMKDRVPAIGQKEQAAGRLAEFRADQLPRVMIMSDAQPRETRILNRGDYLTPGDKVEFSTPAFLPALPADAPRNRLGFARWLVSGQHPLTARVQVNRMWQYFFGTGLVRTSEDLGVQSEYPEHLPLLDWLATEFPSRGWSLKQMHRLIVTSAAYRQSSRVTPELSLRDPENRLMARASRFRMPAMILRDWALATAGLLDVRIGGPPVYPYQPDGIWESLAITKERDFTYPASSGNDLYRRSLYTFWRRTVGPANMFDASNRQACRVRMTPTSTPLHALTTLNDPTWVEAARVLAERCLVESSDTDGRLTLAFRRVAGRVPSAADLVVLRRLLQRQQQIYATDAAAAKALI